MIDFDGYYPADTVHVIAHDDFYLLGVLNSSSIDWYFREISSTIRGGYLRFKPIYMETLPIPDAPTAERKAIAKLAEQAQSLHTQRRKRVEKFLRDLGTSPAQSSSRNPLEQPWALAPEEFTRRVKKLDLRGFENLEGLYIAARDETAAWTEQIAQVEKEIDERVAGAYGF